MASTAKTDHRATQKPQYPGHLIPLSLKRMKLELFRGCSVAVPFPSLRMRQSLVKGRFGQDRYIFGSIAAVNTQCYDKQRDT